MTQPNQPDSVEEMVAEFIDEWSQSGLMDLAGGSSDFITSLKQLLTQAKAEEREKQNGEWVLQIEEWIERLEELKKALQDNK